MGLHQQWRKAPSGLRTPLTKDLEVSYENLSYEMGFWNVEGSNAYAVIAGRFTVTFKGQTVVRTGTLAYTFSKHGEEWKIDAQAGAARRKVSPCPRRRSSSPQVTANGRRWS